MEEISHSGIVRSVYPDKTVVEIISQSACSSCHVQGLCSAADAVKKEVVVPGGGSLREGDQVEVVLRESMGRKAALLSYFVPVVLLLLVVVGLSYTSIHELWAGVAGVGAVALWYFVLWLLRGRLGKEYVFTIKRNKSL